MGDKSIKKVSTGAAEIKLFDLTGIVEHSMRKIAFVREFFNHSVPDDELFSPKARAGFHFIMDDLENDLELVLRGLLKICSDEIAGTMKASKNRESMSEDTAPTLLDSIETGRSAGRI